MSKFFKRLILFALRGYKARRLGVRFSGTSSFSLPRRLRLCGTEITINAPSEISLGSDFINVILDDEYGLLDVPRQLRTIVDVGGNIGLFSLWARNSFPDAIIHCYEPNERVLPYLEGNLDERDVSVFNEAVGGKASIVEMDDSCDSRNARTRDSHQGTTVQVAMETVVERAGGTIDLLKLDCEGAEWEIFRNPAALKSVKRIRLEYHLIGGNNEVADLMLLVDAAGFNCEKLQENNGFGIAWLTKQ